MADGLSKTSGWTRVAFGDVVEKVSESGVPTSEESDTYIGLEHLETESLAVRRWGSEVDIKVPKTRVKRGDVLFARRNTHLRRCAVAPFDTFFSPDGYAFRSKSQLFLHDLLIYVVASDRFMNFAIEHSAGTHSKRVKWSDLSRFEFDLPPLPQQRRIARALTSAERAISSAEDARVALDAVVLALNNEYFLRNRRQQAGTRVGDVATVRNGTTPSRSEDAFWGGTIPWLPTGKVNDRRIREADEFITKRALNECSLEIIPADSTLVAMIGQGATRGKSAYLEIDATINQNFAAVVPGPSVHPEFLFDQLDASYEGLRHWSQGSNQLALNCELVADFPIWVPGRDVQDEIVSNLQTLRIARECLTTRVDAGVRFRNRLVAGSIGAPA